MINSTHIRVITVLLAALAASASFGQTTSADAPSSTHISVEIVDQPGCPLRLTVLSTESAASMRPPTDAAKPPKQTTIRLRADNLDAKPVRGYAIGFDGGKTKIVSTTLFGKPLEKGQVNVIPSTASGEWSSVLISVDYVEFSDGTTWGTDLFKRSQEIESFFKGRDRAIGHLNEIVTSYPDYEFFLKQVSAFRGNSGSGPVSPPIPGMLQSQFEFGYDSVLKGLRAPTKRLAEGQEIARKLELLEQTPAPNER